MKAEDYIKRSYDADVKTVDDPSEDIVWRFCVYFRHVGRLEALVMTHRITMDRYDELMEEWKKHWPARRTK